MFKKFHYFIYLNLKKQRNYVYYVDVLFDKTILFCKEFVL